jgi:uncharacterized protein (UPF0332 family)
MKSLNFLIKLKKEGKLEIVEISKEMSTSYEKKGIECREVAKLTFNSNYFESAITQSYYSMYNNLLSLFFKCGIKCENHSASAIILRDIFNQKELYEEFSKAKEERIDKQYYTPASQSTPLTKEFANQTINLMTSFNPKIIALKINLNSEEINKIREKINSLT